ncbi:MAG: AAA family ATPase [Candidatus Oleimicrobiaceae bacterium]
MVIESLRLHNYRRFRTLELTFPENLIGIIGRNGVGKSTIVEAVGWALYGNRVVRTDKMDVRSQSASEKEVCEAELVFTCSGQQYRVLRRLKGKNAIAEAAAYRGNAATPVATHDSGVTEFIEGLLGLDYQSFFASVFARQKELDALSRMEKAERLRCINRLVNIDLVDHAREQVRQDRNQRRAYCNGLRATLKDEAELRQRLAQVDAALQDKRAQEQQAGAELAKARQALQRAKKELEALSATRDRFWQLSNRQKSLDERRQDLQRSLESARHDLGSIDQAAERLKELAPRVAELAPLRAEKERLDSAAAAAAARQAKSEELTAVTRHLKGLRANLGALKEKASASAELAAELRAASEMIANLQREIAATEEHLRKMAEERGAIERKGRELREKRQQVEKLGPLGPCPVCARPLGDQHGAVLHNFDQELAQLREQFRALQQREARARQQQAQLKDELARWQVQEKELVGQKRSAEEAAAQLEQTQRQVNEQEERRVALEREIASLSLMHYDERVHIELKQRLEKLTNLHDIVLGLRAQVERRERVVAEIARLEGVIQESTAQLAEVAEELAKVGFDEATYLEAQQLVEQCSQVQDQRQEAHSLVREELAKLEKEREGIVADLEHQQRQLQEIATAEEEIHYLELLHYHFDIFRQELVNRLRPLIASRASELLRLTTQGRYSLIALDSDYGIRLYDGTTPYPLPRFSGGEQDLVNLCLRIAISQVVAERSGVTPMNFIVLDEIFGSQDEQRRQLILEALNQLSGRFRQVFVITHIEHVRDSLPVIISVDEEGEHESVARPM